jgi:dTDP-glucose pyrophosphorylase
MVKKGYEYAVLEVSSHGIDQARIAGVDFNIGVLTNIAPEHLDYHKTFEEYKRVKLSFINSAQEKVISPAKSSLNVLPGEFNNINAETAVNVAELLGIDRKRAISSLASFKLPAGRMEEIKNDLGVRIFVDFAHTPDSLEKALIYLKGITKGRLISVFGCAGERDPGKRSEMGKISSRIADLSVFTAEDPRTEDIFSIFRSMKKYAKNFVTIPERGEAIVHALSIARKGDTVAFFGKGHEKSLSYKGFEHPWSDQEMISSLINSSYKGISVIVLAAGRGTRMKSDKPKVLHEICGRPMLAYTLENLRFAGLMDVVVVVNFRKNWVMRAVGGAVKFAYQKTPKGGTADAANSGFPKVSKGADTIVVINGDDSAFYKPETIRRVIDIHKERQRILTFVSLMKEDPYGLGRVIRGRNGLITKIVEEKDATEAERRIKEVNDGLYVFEKKWFAKSIGKVKKGPQGEYYLVDLVKLAIDEGQRMATYTLPDDSEWQGINTPQQLEEANRKMLLKLKAYN